jgi:O-antigen ligase
VAALVLSGIAMAWREHGSIAAEDWLPYTILAAFLLATLLAFTDVDRPDFLPLAALGGLAGLSFWIALSVAWSPVPSLARDEAMLLSVYALSFSIPLLLRGSSERHAEVALVGLAAAAVAVATAVHLVRGASPADFTYGRLTFPVGYVNANAAVFLLGFWSAVALAARRPLPVAVRAVALGGATAVLAGWLATQSKGAGIALGASAVVVLALAPSRLRLLLPLLIPAALVAAAYGPLTAPFRARDDAALASAGRDTGEALLLVAALALVAGVVYALADRRIEVSSRARRAAGVAAAGALVVALAAGLALFAARVDHPRAYLADKWAAFKSLPSRESGGSHLVNLGSNRYDFWRVELQGFKEHPLAGIGARGFATQYLEERRSAETPARGHSLPLDTALETGIVGLLLLAIAFGALLVAVARRARTTAGVAALGTLAYFGVHVSGDWIWTFPAIGVPVFALAGVALSSEEPLQVPRRVSLAAAGLAALVALAAVPPFLSSRITDEALRTADPGALDDARRLDPLSIDPWLAQATLARTPSARVDALRHGLEREPRSTALHLLLGRALLDVGRRDEAISVLEEAQRLDPRGEEVAAALELARRAP